MSEPYTPESAMAIFAHPDDIEFSCGGTMARWAKAGARICYLIVTNGDVGIADPEIPKDEVIRIRREESVAAAKAAGVDNVVFMDEHDGMLEPTMELRKRLVREIRRFKPEVVITGDPTIVFASETYINHPDHRAAATVALDAVFPAAGQPNLFEEIEHEDGITAHKPRKVYISSWRDATTFVNIEDTIETKIAALREHKSQMMDWDPAEPMRERAASVAQGKEMAYAEGFRVITLTSDDDWALSKGDPIVLAEAAKNRLAEKEANGASEA